MPPYVTPPEGGTRNPALRPFGSVAMEDALVMSIQMDLAALAAITGAGGDLDGALVGLYKAGGPPTRETDLSALTEADYNGYAREAVTWDAPSIADDGTPEVLGSLGEFRPTNNLAPNPEILGAFLVEAGGDYRAGAQYVSGPLAMVETTDVIRHVVRLRFAPDGLLVLIS